MSAFQDLTNKRFNRLIISSLEEKKKTSNGTRTYWKCICDCGNIVVIASDKLKNKIRPTGSCGCLQKEAAINQFLKINKERAAIGQHPQDIKYEHIYVEKHDGGGSYNDGDISLEKFKELSKLPCSYCAKTKVNARKYIIKDILNQYSEKDLILQYNGLDRIDNTRGHYLNNVVPCCGPCNMKKSNLPIDIFWNKIIKIKQNYVFPVIEIRSKEEMKDWMLKNDWLRPDKRKSNKLAMSASCKELYRIWHHSYRDGNIHFEQFLQLSLENCSYCGCLSSESTSIASYTDEDGIKKIINYNALDRLDNNQGHTIENVIPACGLCNKIKHSSNLIEFLDWIDTAYSLRPKTYQ